MPFSDTVITITLIKIKTVIEYQNKYVVELIRIYKEVKRLSCQVKHPFNQHLF